MRKRCLRSGFVALLAVAGGASCSSFGGADPGKAKVYAECNDAEAAVTWEAAKRELQDGDDQSALAKLIQVVARCPQLVRAHVAYQDAARRLGGATEQRMVDWYMTDASANSFAAPQLAGTPLLAYLRARLADTAYAQANALAGILAQNKSFAWASLSLGRVNRSQGRLSEALQNFEAAIGYDASLFEARLERAQVLAELGRDEEAAMDYAQYCDKNPADMAATREYVTLLLYRLDKIDEALMRIELLETLGDKTLSLRMDRAAAMWRNNLPQASIEIYLEILQAAPKTARAALNIGLLYYEIVPKDEADRRRFWPKARAAFALFLQATEPSDGHEQFERTWAVPFRLGRIAELLGPSLAKPTLDDLRWPK